MFDTMEVCPDCESEVSEDWSGDFVCAGCGGYWERTDEDDDELEESYDSGADCDGAG